MKNTDFTPYLTMPPTEIRKLQWTRGWAMSLIGSVVYAALRLFGQKPKDYHGICPYFEMGNSWGGAYLGWFFICCKNCGESVKTHEVGHGIQNAAVGGLKMLGYSIGSGTRYLWREVFKPNTPYDSWFFEGDATRIGTEYVHNHTHTHKI